MALEIGVNVIEVDGRASPTIQAAQTSVAAFLGLTERGGGEKTSGPHPPPKLPPPPRSLSPPPRADGYLAYAIEGFLLNGGREAYISRVVGANSDAAFATLNNRVTPGAGPALRVTAGYRGRPDPGPWGNSLRLAVRDDPRGTAKLKASTGANANTATLDSLGGFRVGSVVRFVDGANTFHRKITAIDATTGTITWDAGAQIVPVLNQATTQVTSAEFRLIVRYQATPADDFAVVEEWPQLSLETDSPDYAVSRVNHSLTGSRYITVADLSGSAATGVENPAVTSNQALAGGTETAAAAADYSGNAAQKTGFYGFDTVQVQLLAVPDAHTVGGAGRVTVVRAALDYCAGRGDCTFVGSAPDRGTGAAVTPRALSDYTQLESDYLTTTKTYSANFQASKVFGALYAPWIQVNDPTAVGSAPVRFVPPEGHLMGVYARTEQERGIWKAPAGNAAQVRGALGVSATFTDGQHTDLVRNGFVNGIRFEAGNGIIVAASRTLSTDTRWWFVNVRLLFNFVKSSLRDGLRFVRQEPHSEALRRSVRLNVVMPFLMGLWRQGAFGSGKPADLFTVKCDAENNPPSEVNLGNFKIEVYFYPVKPAETILLVVGQQPSGGSASEA
jgi:phage tail sheath protein FI